MIKILLELIINQQCLVNLMKQNTLQGVIYIGVLLSSVIQNKEIFAQLDELDRDVLVFLNFCKSLVSIRFCGVCARYFFVL